VLVIVLVLDFLDRYRSKADCDRGIVVVVVVVLLVGEALDDEDEHD
jgi:hypothetical protein